jgi:hypothetical protein
LVPFSHSSNYARLTDEQHRLIGMFVTEWATAEFTLGVLLSRLLLAPEFLARTYTDSLGAAQIQQAICQAVEIHRYRYGEKLIGDERLGDILQVNQEIGVLRALRNKFAHFCWMRTSDDDIFGTSFSGAVPSDRKSKRTSASLEVKEIRRQYDALYAAVERLQQIVEELPSVPEEAAIQAFRGMRDAR